MNILKSAMEGISCNVISGNTHIIRITKPRSYFKDSIRLLNKKSVIPFILYTLHIKVYSAQSERSIFEKEFKLLMTILNGN